GEEEDDRERLDALALHAPAGAAHGLLVERRDHVALEVEPLGDAVAAAARADGRRGRLRRVPDVLLVAAADLDLVAMALAGEEAGGGSRHLDHRVVGGGSALHGVVGRGEERLAGEGLARRGQSGSVTLLSRVD